MGKVFADISMSLDGFVAGPDALGEGGERLHERGIPPGAILGGLVG